MTATTARTIALTIPGMPAYSLSPNSRVHWRVKHREGEAVMWAVRSSMQTYTGPFFAVPVRLHWTVYLAKGGKRRDADNILPCLKHHQDSLVSEGILPGDSPRWIRTTPTVDQIPWSEHRGDPRIVVEITEAV